MATDHWHKGRIPGFPILTRRAALQSLTGAAASGLTRLASSATRERKPNFIILLSDDLGYGDVGCFASPVPTPHIDNIAAQGSSIHRRLCDEPRLQSFARRTDDRP